MREYKDIKAVIADSVKLRNTVIYGLVHSSRKCNYTRPTRFNSESIIIYEEENKNSTRICENEKIDRVEKGITIVQ